MDRFGFIDAQPWIQVGAGSAPAESGDSTSDVQPLFRGAASFHLSLHEQYQQRQGTAGPTGELQGALAADAKHVYFATSSSLPDAAQLAFEISEVCGSEAATNQHLASVRLDGRSYLLDCRQIIGMVLQESPSGLTAHPRIRTAAVTDLPPYVSVVFAHVTLNVFPLRAPGSGSDPEAHRTQVLSLQSVVELLAALRQSGAPQEGGRDAGSNTSPPAECNSTGEHGACTVVLSDLKSISRRMYGFTQVLAASVTAASDRVDYSVGSLAPPESCLAALDEVVRGWTLAKRDGKGAKHHHQALTQHLRTLQGRSQALQEALFARPSSHPQPGGQSNANVRQLTSVLTEIEATKDALLEFEVALGRLEA